MRKSREEKRGEGRRRRWRNQRDKGKRMRMDKELSG
jgi:hypothetical protein